MTRSVQQPRAYVKRRRAQTEAETRRRITEATVELHREVGPANTTISAVADRAGVQRLTVYRHFPEEIELIRACSAHWRAAHPAPDPSPWVAIEDPEERLRTALGELYAYYRSDEAMISNIRRDTPAVAALATVVSDVPLYFDAVRDILARGWGARGKRRKLLLAAIGHAIEFETWRSLERRQGLEANAAVELAAAGVLAAAAR